ncbi:MAG: hypothetical protein LCH46_05265 [Proteobacteria bacterium]|nr:hypothetical protein [Pseudomonadota bacterium]
MDRGAIQITPPVPEDEVRQSLDRILQCGVLGEGSRLPTLLRYIVEEELSGRGASLKAYTIATVVFQRASSFDPNTDSIVRVEFSRLRQLLATYQLLQGRDDPIQIDVPSGGYRPKFSRAAAQPLSQGAALATKKNWGPLVLGLALAAAVAVVASLATHFLVNPSGGNRLAAGRPAVLVEPVRLQSAAVKSVAAASMLHEYMLVAAAQTLDARIIDANVHEPSWRVLDEGSLTLNLTLDEKNDFALLLVRLVSIEGEQLWTQSYEGVHTTTPGWEKTVVDRVVADLKQKFRPPTGT